MSVGQAHRSPKRHHLRIEKTGPGPGGRTRLALENEDIGSQDRKVMTAFWRQFPLDLQALNLALPSVVATCYQRSPCAFPSTSFAAP